MPKAVIIGRHRLLPAQKRDLQLLGADETIQAPTLDEENLEQQVREWAAQGTRYIIVQALPLRLLLRLHKAATQHGIEILIPRMEHVALADTREEAEAIIAEAPDKRTYLQGRGDEKIRIIEFHGWEKIKRLEAELEPATPRKKQVHPGD